MGFVFYPEVLLTCGLIFVYFVQKSCLKLIQFRKNLGRALGNGTSCCPRPNLACSKTHLVHNY